MPPFPFDGKPSLGHIARQMQWYYEEDGERRGPIDEEGFQDVVLAGTIDPDTLVWKPGMATWLPYGYFQDQGEAPLVPGQARCVECGNYFDAAQLVQYGDDRVCAGCKPIYTQRLIESGHRATITRADGSTEEIRFAGFWIRVGAAFVDVLALSPLIGPLTYFYIMGVINEGTNDIQDVIHRQLVSFAQGTMMTLIYIAYYIFMHAKYQASVGKIAFGIKVVRADGTRISTRLAVGRAFAWEISSMLCNIGYLFAAFDQEKRALHDMICNTRVIYKPTSTPVDPAPVLSEPTGATHEEF
ncbi:MAG: putative RDD family membrane protein YckC [Kiritimatiellia bacterium]